MRVAHAERSSFLSRRRGGDPRDSRLAALRRHEGGALLLAVVAMLALFSVTALVTDGGHVWAARTELQNAADAAALAGAADLVNPTNTSVELAKATVSAQIFSSSNEADQKSIAVPSENLTFGDWDLQASVFNPGTPSTLSDPNQVTAVRVSANLDEMQNGPVETVLARIMGRGSFEIGAMAIGYLGFAGSINRGDVDLPLAIDCCAITQPDSSCDDFSCAALEAKPPNFGSAATDGCFLADGAPATCLEFHSSPEQNACWTEFDGDSQSVTPPGLFGVLQAGNPESVSVDHPIFVDNGTMTPTVDDVADKFYGTGSWLGDPHGQDTNGDAIVDTWRVGLPVISCQSSSHCAGGSPAAVVGAVCFEIQEIEVTPEKRIKGLFFCPDETRSCGFEGGTGPGGKRFGIRATRAVLVR